MVDSQEFQRRLLEAKLEALAEFAAGAGHEINNPVATISGRAQLLLRDEADPGRREMLESIGAQALRIRDMIGDLMLFARPPAPDPQSIDLGSVVQEVVSRLAHDADRHHCTVDIDLQPDVVIWADKTQVAVVVSELLRNSFEAVEKQGTVRVSVQSQQSDSGTVGRLTVSDNGQGLSDIDREHLFDPYYSGRQAGRGLGFGLPKCWRIVTNHGGRIEVSSEPGQRTTFVVDWPTQVKDTVSPNPDRSS